MILHVFSFSMFSVSQYFGVVPRCFCSVPALFSRWFRYFRPAPRCFRAVPHCFFLHCGSYPIVFYGHARFPETPFYTCNRIRVWLLFFFFLSPYCACAFCLAAICVVLFKQSSIACYYLFRVLSALLQRSPRCPPCMNAFTGQKLCSKGRLWLSRTDASSWPFVIFPS